jgi:hypothetical protein
MLAITLIIYVNPNLFHGYETWSFILKEEYTLGKSLNLIKCKQAVQETQGNYVSKQVIKLRWTRQKYLCKQMWKFPAADMATISRFWPKIEKQKLVW